MNLTTEQQRWLTEEFLGLCWHEKVSDGNDVWGPGYTPPICSCGKTISRMTISHVNLDFTDWRTFGILWNKIQAHEQWEEFIDADMAAKGHKNWLVPIGYINPTRFALAIYDFFNGGNDEQ